VQQFWLLKRRGAAVPHRIRGLVTLTAIITMSTLTAACTPTEPPASSPSPAPSASSPTPTPTPTETEFQRQEREAYEGAEKAYRTFVAEYNATISTTRPHVSAGMRQVAGGPFLSDYAGFLRERRKREVRTIGENRVANVDRISYSPTRVLFKVCEDGTKSRLVDTNGKRVARGIASTLDLTVRLRGGAWKVWEGGGQKVVKTCGK
jgi:hypothetical protein